MTLNTALSVSKQLDWLYDYCDTMFTAGKFEEAGKELLAIAEESREDKIDTAVLCGVKICMNWAHGHLEPYSSKALRLIWDSVVRTDGEHKAKTILNSPAWVEPLECEWPSVMCRLKSPAVGLDTPHEESGKWARHCVGWFQAISTVGPLSSATREIRKIAAEPLYYCPSTVLTIITILQFDARLRSDYLYLIGECRKAWSVFDPALTSRLLDKFEDSAHLKEVQSNGLLPSWSDSGEMSAPPLDLTCHDPECGCRDIPESCKSLPATSGGGPV